MCEELLEGQIKIAHQLWFKGLSTHDITSKLLIPEFMIANNLEKIRNFNPKKG